MKVGTDHIIQYSVNFTRSSPMKQRLHVIHTRYRGKILWKNCEGNLKDTE